MQRSAFSGLHIQRTEPDRHSVGFNCSPMALDRRQPCNWMRRLIPIVFDVYVVGFRRNGGDEKKESLVVTQRSNKSR